MMMTSATRIAGWLLLAVFVTASRAQAATYYVSTSGSDTNSGTLTSPYATIGKCASSMTAGDTCYLRGGTYDMYLDSGVHNVSSGTSWANAVTFKNYNGETVWLRPTSGQGVIGLQSKSYIIFDGLNLDGSGSAANENCFYFDGT